MFSLRFIPSKFVNARERTPVQLSRVTKNRIKLRTIVRLHRVRRYILNNRASLFHLSLTDGELIGQTDVITAHVVIRRVHLNVHPTRVKTLLFPL